MNSEFRYWFLTLAFFTCLSLFFLHWYQIQKRWKENRIKHRKNGIFRPKKPVTFSKYIIKINTKPSPHKYSQKRLSMKCMRVGCHNVIYHHQHCAIHGEDSL